MGRERDLLEVGLSDSDRKDAFYLDNWMHVKLENKVERVEWGGG